MNSESKEIKQAGLKITLPRIKILQILESSTQDHLSAEDVYKALIAKGEEIGLATVYRVLTKFEEAGLVVKHNFEGGHSIFEVTAEEHHDHIVCLGCGKVQEFQDDDIEVLQEKVASRMGFSLTEHSVNMYGYWENCQ